MTRTRKILLALDQFFGALLFDGIFPDESISAMAHRRGWKRLEKVINWLFRDDMHCAQAYVAEMTGTQNAKVYHRG